MVVRGWEELARAGVETNILCTVNAANEAHGSLVYRYFRDELGARYLQFIPIVERVRAADLAQAERGWRSGTSALLYRQDGDCVTSRSTSPSGYGRFLCEVFDQWLATDVGEVFIQDVDSTLAAMFGSASVCVHARTCGVNMAMEFNGDVCWGGCPKDRFVRRGDGAHNYLCEGYRAFYEHATPVLRAMGMLIAAGRPASDIMDPAVAASLGVCLPSPASSPATSASLAGVRS